jgi:regulator of protease activity HflC (stomatin/prohibitin superfamily)
MFEVWTKDGIKVTIEAEITCRIGDPAKNDPISGLIYTYDPLAIKKAIERHSVRWPNRQDGEPSEFTWLDAAWGQVVGIVPSYISSRVLDDLFLADRNGGQILSSEAIQEIYTKINEATNDFGVFVTEFQVLKVALPREVEQLQKEYWKAEKQRITSIKESQSRAYNIRAQGKAQADAQHNLIMVIAEGLEKNKDSQFTEPLLLSLSGVVDESIQDPLVRAYMTKEALDVIEQIQKILDNDKQ